MRRKQRISIASATSVALGVVKNHGTFFGVIKFKMNEEKRRQILHMLDYRQHVILAKAEWVQAEIERYNTTQK